MNIVVKYTTNILCKKYMQIIYVNKYKIYLIFTYLSMCIVKYTEVKEWVMCLS